MGRMVRISDDLDELIRGKGGFGESKSEVLFRLITDGNDVVERQCKACVDKDLEIERLKKLLADTDRAVCDAELQNNIKRWVKEQRKKVGGVSGYSNMLDSLDELLSV